MRKQCKYFKGVPQSIRYDDGGVDHYTDWCCDNKECYHCGEPVGLLSECEDCSSWEV